MNACPQCGKPRQADEYRCLACGCFYSQLDEILAAEAEQEEAKSLKGMAKRIIAADDSKHAFKEELRQIYQRTPRRTLFTFWVIFAFVFALVVSVL